MRQLKRLLVGNWTKFGRHSDNGWFNAAVLEITTSLLKSSGDPDWRIYFQLCFLFWKEAFVRYRVYLEVTKANVVFAQRHGRIGSQTANEMISEALAAGTHHEVAEEASLTALMDFETSLKDPQEVRMDILAREVADLSVLEHLAV